MRKFYMFVFTFINVKKLSIPYYNCKFKKYALTT